jgi:type IV pilus assembly protein PilE
VKTVAAQIYLRGDGFDGAERLEEGSAMSRRNARGFTLLELMITVGIVAILAAIAYPSYSNFAYRTRRADGRELLMRIAAAQERFYTNRNTYATTIGALNVGGASEKGYYTVADPAVANAGQTYILTATPIDIQANDTCGKLEVNNIGTKTAPDDSGLNGKCW